MMRTATFGVVAILSTGIASAQFHSQDKTGGTTINQQAVNSAQMQAAAAVPTGANNSNFAADAHSIIYVSDAHRENYGARMGEQQNMGISVWGRSIHHSDGTYTESKTDFEDNFLQQETKSENGVTLQTRMITLDQRGQPSEVMIYDARKNFKYRGVLLYDPLGRFSEEQIYDPEGTLIRRKVQEYLPNGRMLPVRSVDYVANVPDDLKLVITRESEEPGTAPATASNENRRGLFSNQKKEVAAPAGEMRSEVAAPVKSKGLNLGRMFGGRRESK